MPTLYPKNRTPTLDLALFRAPTAEYRGTPFWSWNCKLERGRLLEQIEHLKAMGMGGFHMHSRVGLATEYLGGEFMDHVKACVQKAKDERMLAWLYDEDRWPSGAAGGLVTKDARFREKQLAWTVETALPGADELGKPGPATLLARHAVTLDGGVLRSYRRLRDGEAARAGETVWHAFLRSVTRNSWYNNYTYLDTLSKPAVEAFIRSTHEKYRAAVGADFGTTVPAIFSDEPMFGAFDPPNSGDDRRTITLSWTDDLADTYRAAFAEDILDKLPELFWELPDGAPSRARWRWHDHHTERFAAAFADTIGAWCEQAGILFTGHMMEEPTLTSQTRMIGEAMRSYRGFTLPGIDMLCDWMELTTAKQAQSASRQYGRPGVMSELYGVTNWDFDFTGHKRQGDWQAALGITVRVPHLSWVSMAGEAKRDYPAAIDEHSPWYREYPLVEDHFARLNVALTRGAPVCRVAVVHPIESFWLAFGCRAETRLERDAREQQFSDVTRWLLHGLVDFDFLCEGLLRGQSPRVEDGRLRVGASAYEAVVVPGLRTIRSTTLAALEAFADAGGSVIFAGIVPTLVDAEPSQRAAKLAARATRVEFARPQLLAAVERFRDVAVDAPEGGPRDHLLYQMRADGANRALFVCNTSRDWRHGGTLRVRGRWRARELDTRTGERRDAHSWTQGEWTALSFDGQAAGHALLELEPAPAGWTSTKPAPGPEWKEVGRLADPVPVTLSEPNVLLLDQAEFRLDGGAWQPLEEVLRIGNRVREQLGLPARHGGMAQPWVQPREPSTHRLGVRFRVRCDAAVRGAALALEGADAARIAVDGAVVATKATGWWVDHAIQTVPLPDLAAGERVIEVELPFGRHAELEWMYLLGDFSVAVQGRWARVGAPVRELAFGDWTRQGLPFYAGNVTYRCRIAGDAKPTRLWIPRFRAPLVVAEVDGARVGPIAFPPYRLELGALAPGDHRLDLTAFGSRINAFGALHNCNPHERWYGPHGWRSEGADWSYEYQIRPCGILVAPIVERG